MARLFKANHHLHPTRSPYRGKRAYQKIRQAIGYRARTITNGWGNEGRPEAIIKFSSRLKSRKTAIAAINYVARVEESEEEEKPKPIVCDEYGTPLGEKSLKNTIEDWDLQPDENNRSRKARDLINQGDMEEFFELGNKGLRNIQARHIILSIKSGEDEEKEAEALGRAAFSTLDNFFTADGFRFIWAVHRDCPDHLHAHAIIKAQSRYGNRLWIDRMGDFRHTLRTDFAFNLSAVGLPHQATCREDRKETRQNIMAGIEPLRMNDSQAKLALEDRGESDNQAPPPSLPEQGFNLFPKNWLSGRKRKKTKKQNPALEKVIKDRETVARQLHRIADLDEILRGNPERAEQIHKIIKSDQQIPIIQTPALRNLKPIPSGLPVKITKKKRKKTEKKEKQMIYSDQQGCPLPQRRKTSRSRNSRGQER